MNEGFTVSDMIATGVAFFLFALFLLIPGYVCGWLGDIFGFSRRSLLARFAISVPISIGLCPVLTYLLWHWSIGAVWVMYGAFWAGFAALLIHDWRIWLSRPRISKRKATFVAIVAGWVILGLLCLIDLQIGHRLYSPTVAYDYMLRVAITAAITHTGIPPHNPYFFAGGPFILRYHYFWFIPSSLVEQLGGSLVSSRQAVLAGTLWCGIGLIALVALYLRFFQPKGPVNLDRRMLLGVALLGVTGLDILPVAFFELVTRKMIPSIEWWNSPVMAWVHAVLWVPHHVAGLIACLTGLLVIWYASDERPISRQIVAGVASGLMLASAVGLSIYVTFIFAAFLAIWLVITIVKKHRREAAVITIAATIALTAAAPYFSELLKGNPGQGSGGGPFVQFTIRPFVFAEAMVETCWPNQPWLKPIANLLLLRLNYFLELGFFFTVGMIQWRRTRRGGNLFNHKELCGFTMVATSLFVCTFLRSSVISNNDLGWRGLLMAQFILLIWASELLDEGLLASHSNVDSSRHDASPFAPRRSVMVSLVVLGVAGSIYEVCMVRFYPLISDSAAAGKYQWLSPGTDLGRRTYALRQIYQALKNKLLEHAVVQHDPKMSPGDVFYGMYADRQAVAETPACGAVFGGDPALCPGIIGPLNDLFEKPEAISTDRVDAVCRNLSIDALVVKDTDKIWADRNSWVWKKQPAFANDYARAFLCGHATESQPTQEAKQAGHPR
ncbi:MAG TPA: hypothetical protein VEU11_08805 [Terriglobales bacterium]|nr:hypothetical protein [Terriglobales bacterium]